MKLRATALKTTEEFKFVMSVFVKDVKTELLPCILSLAPKVLQRHA
jgi:hypothetical protein